METPSYLDKFQKSVDHFNMEQFSQKKLECKVGVWLQSVALKIQKKSWINASRTARPFEESIFFSVWLSDELIQSGKLYYNTHALKLRELIGYSIKSREFADAFRTRFKPFEKRWPNVSVNFGPLTLMEGWVTLDNENLEAIIMDLAYKFLEIEFIIDDLLKERKKNAR
ncbi:MAG: hypothetical protein JWR38_2207 [Mucilaginibacter sp.]|nr:hypothetical protein [Mucilaginibacter sp.]